MEVGGLLSLLHYGDGLVGGILLNSVQLERKGRMIAISTAIHMSMGLDPKINCMSQDTGVSHIIKTPTLRNYPHIFAIKNWITNDKN